MKHLKKFNESSFDNYIKSEDFYKDLIDRLFNEIDDYFKDKKRFFPLKIQLNKGQSKGEVWYSGSVCMSMGCITRLNDEEEKWLSNKLEDYKKKWNINFSMCGDSYSSSIIYDIENNDWPKNTLDYLNFPPNPFPERDDDYELED